MEETTFTLPSDLVRELRELSELIGCPMDSLVVAALDIYLSQHRRVMPRSIGAGANGTLNAAEIEDWLKANWHPLE